MTGWDESKGYMPGMNQRHDAELANERMTQSSPPTCSWRPGDSEALRIALSIPVTSSALAALNREMALLQTHYPTGVCLALVRGSENHLFPLLHKRCGFVYTESCG